MEALQFLRSPAGESVVQFTGEEIHLGTVVTNHGVIGGYENRTMFVDAARLILTTNTTREISQRGFGSERTSLIVEDRRIRAEGVDNFVVTEPETGRPLFSAKRPRFQLSRKSIKKIAVQQIVTNKLVSGRGLINTTEMTFYLWKYPGLDYVRSPVDKALRFQVENLSFRGNEANKFKAKTFLMSAKNNLGLRTSESGAIRLKAGRGVFTNAASRFPISSSPALRANVLGYRLCVCSQTGRIFAVPGNKACFMDYGSCF